MDTNKKFNLELCSNLDFEGMIVDICFDHETIATLNYDKGIENIEIQFFPYYEEIPKTFSSLEDFISILEKAKKLTIQCAEEDKLRKEE